MTEYYNDVFIVHGNHDLYLINDKQKKKYHSRSIERIEEIQEWCDTQSNIHFLDGNVVNIDGLKIGGFGNWYNLDTIGKIASWNEVMNDSNLIMDGAGPIRFQYGYGASHKESQWDTQGFRIENEKKMQNIIDEKCDILLCHIIPAIIPDEHMFHGHVGEGNNIFYMTDDIEKVIETGAEVVIYGHNHSVKEFDLEGITFATNALGYPMEYGLAKKIEHFDFTK